jgi:hypothetical protein
MGTLRRRGAPTAAGTIRRHALVLLNNEGSNAKAKRLSIEIQEGAIGTSARNKSTFLRLQERANAAFSFQELSASGLGGQLMYILQVNKFIFCEPDC